METLIVILIIGLALAFLGRRAWGLLRGQGSGCHSCGQNSQCQLPENGQGCASFEAFEV